MQWISENWIWVLVGVLFFAAHLFGHGGHGGHGGHREPRDGSDPSSDRQREPLRGSDHSGHRH
ncbi:MAG: DUF2933 domain-containing protein [Burkholderiales bacterium]|nr:DUF2933 domain-containing protein [Burkholderiales bacterium]MDE2297362.1 DUF2933 domain-containing protein [Burkholderiales bacterium]MDE2626258.1 DUF2933 domain-containing protein [Burkholderiales bacterium]